MGLALHSCLKDGMPGPNKTIGIRLERLWPICYRTKDGIGWLTRVWESPQQGQPPA